MTSTKRKPTARDRLEANPLRSLVRTFGLLERVMQPYFARFGISGSQWGILRTLHRAERGGQAGLRLTDLSERLLIRPPSVTGAVDRMERAGLVSRAASVTDLRAKQICLTSAGRRLIEEILAGHENQIDRVLGGLRPAEQTSLQDLLDRLGHRLEELLNNGRPTRAAAPSVRRRVT